MANNRLPIIVLGGSDSRPGHVPKELESADMLSGCKGALALPSGQTVAAALAGALAGVWAVRRAHLDRPKARLSRTPWAPRSLTPKDLWRS